MVLDSMAMTMLETQGMVIETPEMNKSTRKPRNRKNKISNFITNNLVSISVVISLFSVFILFNYMNWWDAIGLMILNLGLGIKLNGAKTFAVAVAKSGGKKALVITTVGVLLKRHIIDVLGKFFAEHSVVRYKENIKKIFLLKLNDIKNSSPAKRMKALLTTLGVIPVVYLVWYKILGAAIQKIIYGLMYPIFLIVFELLSYGLDMITNIVGFVFQLTLLNYFIDWMEKRPLGKSIIKGITSIIKILGNTFEYVNSIFKIFGFDPKHKLIVYSIRFNRWLEKIINKKSNSREKLRTRRLNHMTSREILINKRRIRKDERKNKKETFRKRQKEFFNEKFLKKKSWKERRISRYEKLSKLSRRKGGVSGKGVGGHTKRQNGKRKTFNLRSKD